MAVGQRNVATITTAAMSTASAAVVATGNTRYIMNDSAAVLYLRFGSGAAVSTDFTVSVAAGGFFTMGDAAYSGPIQGILASGTGTARITSY